jgi:hypothetical protein
VIDPGILYAVWNLISTKILETMDSQRLGKVSLLFKKATECDNKVSSEKLINRAAGAIKKEGLTAPEFEGSNVLYWFKPRSITDLIVIGSYLDQIEDERIRDFFRVCLSSTVRKVSGTRSSEWKLYRIPSSKWGNYDPKTFELFRKVVLTNIEKMNELYQCTQKKHLPSVKIFEADCKDIFRRDFPERCSRLLYDSKGASGKVDSVVTSPPYGDSQTTVAYGQFSRYPLLFLGFPTEETKQIDRMSLGGKACAPCDYEELASKTFRDIYGKVARKDLKRSLQVKSYFVDLDICVRNMFKILKNNGVACLVLGNRTIRGQKMPTDKILIELGREIGFFPPPKIFKRRIPRKRMPWEIRSSDSLNHKVKTISNESIVVLRKSC